MSKKTVTAVDFDKTEIEISIDRLQWRPAAYAVIIKDNKLLVLKQTNGYDLPGGGVEFGETPEEAVLREVKEETGLIASNPRLLDCGTAYFKVPDYDSYRQAIAIYYECDVIDGEFSIDGFDDFEKKYAEGPAWFDLKDLDNMEMGSYRDYKYIIKKMLNENNRD